MLTRIGMKELYSFNKETIEKLVEDRRIGNFTLGNLDVEGTYIPRKVGRSDSDLKAYLLKWFDNSNYSHFTFIYMPTVKRAYEKECNNYHELLPMLNGNPPHPKLPEKAAYKCPNKWCNR